MRYQQNIHLPGPLNYHNIDALQLEIHITIAILYRSRHTIWRMKRPFSFRKPEQKKLVNAKEYLLR